MGHLLQCYSEAKIPSDETFYKQFYYGNDQFTNAANEKIAWPEKKIFSSF